jgi:hypothetical protein
MYYTIYWEQKAFSEFVYNTFLSLIPYILNPETEFERTPWGFTLGGERGIYIERRPSLAYATTYSYLKDLIRVLILMTEFGGASNISYTIDSSEFLKELEELHKMHPLTTYEQQKQSFSKGLA